MEIPLVSRLPLIAITPAASSLFM
uniref:Uncharacterized protein n=1 Tax=Arundo donax TaxID=35708 RepID=A0A0A9C1S7_ARUDO